MEKMVCSVSAYACAICIHLWPSLNRERWGVRLKLNLSQPALSKTLNELEQLTGARLFDRGRLGRNTIVGEQFLTHAVKVLDALNTAGQSLHRKEEQSSEVVRVGALPTAALGILPPVIGQFTSSSGIPRFRSPP
jgi:DNA-binding transcriptional LysR family regulator